MSTNVAPRLHRNPQGFAGFQYKYEMLVNQIQHELDTVYGESSRELSLHSAPDARFDEMVALAVYFYGQQWLLGIMPHSGQEEHWGVVTRLDEQQKRQQIKQITECVDVSGAVKLLMQQVSLLILGKADRLALDWDAAFIKREVQRMTDERAFHWPEGVKLPLYQWSWYGAWDEDENRCEEIQKWSLKDIPDADGYVPFMSLWAENEQPEFIKLPLSAKPSIKRVMVSSTQELSKLIKTDYTCFEVAGIDHSPGNNSSSEKIYAYAPTSTATVSFQQPPKVVQEAIAVLVQQQQAAPFEA